jgi:2-deoxy-D-gluconate 3-dehydrogenase
MQAAQDGSMGNPFSLADRVAVVTGANAGIGQAIAVALAAAGAEVVCAGRSAMDGTLRQIAAAGGRGRALTLDLAQPMGGQDPLVAAGPVDILVNNAGIIRRAASVDYTEADWDAVIDVNLKAVFFLSQAFARAAFARGAGGAIVNIASLLSFQGGIRVPAYTASKHGIAGLTKLLANEWAGRGINVNAVAPGYVETANTDALRADPVRSAAILDRIPAGRWGRPEDIAGAVVFLASPAAAYCHGTVLTVDGGWMAR